MLITWYCTMKESCTQVSVSCYVSTNAFHASCHAFHHAIYLRVAYVSEKIHVDQVRRKSMLIKFREGSSIHGIGAKSNFCGANLLCNKGKPRSI
jgi:hypothetical protein